MENTLQKIEETEKLKQLREHLERNIRDIIAKHVYSIPSHEYCPICKNNIASWRSLFHHTRKEHNKRLKEDLYGLLYSELDKINPYQEYGSWWAFLIYKYKNISKHFHEKIDEDIIKEYNKIERKRGQKFGGILDEEVILLKNIFENVYFREQFNTFFYGVTENIIDKLPLLQICKPSMSIEIGRDINFISKSFIFSIYSDNTENLRDLFIDFCDFLNHVIRIKSSKIQLYYDLSVDKDSPTRNDYDLKTYSMNREELKRLFNRKKSLIHTSYKNTVFFTGSLNIELRDIKSIKKGFSFVISNPKGYKYPIEINLGDAFS